jgi:5-methylcytosine-specific restriction endonuclease McrA
MASDAPWHSFYNTKTWKLRRMVQLQNHPLCALCLERNIIRAARIVHHVTPHEGDWELFRLGELASLCKQHHDGLAQSEERRGFNKGCDVNGAPIADRWQRKQPFSTPASNGGNMSREKPSGV